MRNWRILIAPMVLAAVCVPARADAPSGYQCSPGTPKVNSGCTCPGGFADKRGDENVAICAIARKPSEAAVIKTECAKVEGVVVRAYGADLGGDELKKFRAAFGKAATARCENNAWRKEVRACFGKATTEEAAHDCIELLPPLQRGGLDADAARSHPVEVAVDKSEVKLKGTLVFAQSSADLSNVSDPMIAAIARLLKERPTLRIEIQSHTDNADPADQNLRLSQRRANAVRIALVGAGIGAGRVVARGYGETMPAASNSTAWSRAKNRRIALVVLPADPKAKPDRDGDGIPDADDKCPDQPETINGFEDEDGCPDKTTRVVIDSKIQILDWLQFKSNSAVIDDEMTKHLDVLIGVLKGHPELRIRINGHTDDLEVDPVKLGAVRARNVREYMIKAGVDAQHLEVFTHGDSRPKAVNSTEAGRAQNRRVDFDVL